MFEAWQGERLAREEKLKPLQQYLPKRKVRGRRQAPAEVLAVFTSLESAGVPTRITRLGAR